MPPAAEVRGWARLIAGTAARVVLPTVRGMHRAISDGAYRWVGPIGAPVRRIDHAITDRVYGLVEAGLVGLGEAGAAAGSLLGTTQTPSSRVASEARAIAHGVLDAPLLALAPELELSMTLRHEGRDLEVEGDALAAAHPDARRHLVVFVHGLVHTEAVWSSGGPGSVRLPQLATEAGASPVLVRYPTGRAIGRNGDELATLLERLVAAWPVPVDTLTIVGHSMGGLVARSAAQRARELGMAWPARLRQVVTLASPHLGSWLEKTANVATFTLRTASTRTAPIGALIDRRSRGIKDLRFGMLREDGWGQAPIDGLLTGRVPDEPWCEQVVHHLVVGQLRPDPRHPLNLALGDGLVRATSATGAGRWRRIGPGGPVVVVPVAAPHTTLVRAPAVAEHLRTVLAPRPAA